MCLAAIISNQSIIFPLFNLVSLICFPLLRPYSRSIFLFQPLSLDNLTHTHESINLNIITWFPYIPAVRIFDVDYYLLLPFCALEFQVSCGIYCYVVLVAIDFDYFCYNLICIPNANFSKYENYAKTAIVW